MSRNKEFNKQKQRFLIRLGYKVKVDGSWGPRQERMYLEAITRLKPWKPGFYGTLEGIWNKATGNDTYKINPFSNGSITTDNTSKLSKKLSDIAYNDKTPIAGLARTVLPAAAAAEAIVTAPTWAPKALQTAGKFMTPSTYLDLVGVGKLATPILGASTNLGAFANAGLYSIFAADGTNKFINKPNVTSAAEMALGLSPFAESEKVQKFVGKTSDILYNNIFKLNSKSPLETPSLAQRLQFASKHPIEAVKKMNIKDRSAKAYDHMKEVRNAASNWDDEAKAPIVLATPTAAAQSVQKYTPLSLEIPGLLPFSFDPVTNYLKFTPGWTLYPTTGRLEGANAVYNAPYRTSKVPQDVQNALSSYLSYLKQSLPENTGFAGSSLLASRGLIGDLPKDLELVTTKKNVDAIRKAMHDVYSGANYNASGTLVSRSPRSLNPSTNNGSYDIEIINEDAAGNAIGKLAHEIYASLHPQEYAAFRENVVMQGIKSGKLKQKHNTRDVNTFDYSLPISAEDLLKEYNTGDNALRVQISNHLSSTKEKHAIRARQLYTNPDIANIVRELILAKGKSYIKDYIPVDLAYPNIRYDNILANKLMLKRLNMPEELAYNLEIMRNLAEKIHFDNTHMRSTSPEYAEESEIPLRTLFTTNTAKLRGSGAGGNYTYGISGGTAYGPISIAVQRNFNPDRIYSPMDILLENDRASRTVNTPLSKDIITRVNLVFEKYGVHANLSEGDGINEVDKALINGLSPKYNSALTDEVAQVIDLPYASGGYYHTTDRYVGGYTSKPNSFGLAYQKYNGENPWEPGLREDDISRPVYFDYTSKTKTFPTTIGGGYDLTFNQGSSYVMDMKNRGKLYNAAAKFIEAHKKDIPTDVFGYVNQAGLYQRPNFDFSKTGLTNENPIGTLVGNYFDLDPEVRPMYLKALKEMPEKVRRILAALDIYTQDGAGTNYGKILNKAWNSSKKLDNTVKPLLKAGVAVTTAAGVGGAAISRQRNKLSSKVLDSMSNDGSDFLQAYFKSTKNPNYLEFLNTYNEIYEGVNERPHLPTRKEFENSFHN